jgi:hypothetical protein
MTDIPASATPLSQPPPVPPWPPSPKPPARQGLFSSFSEDFKPIEGPISIASVLEHLLRSPGRLAFEIAQGRVISVVARLKLILAFAMLAYGFVIGSFSGGQQLWVVPLKALGGLWFATLICLPSLYIFACLAGARQPLRTIAGIFLQALAMNGVLLVGFAPVAWLFSQSTHAAAFIGFLHIAFWLMATTFGMTLLISAIETLNQRRFGVLRVWSVIFILVVMQVATMLRPLVGPYAGLSFQEKRFFVAHWFKCMDEPERP